MNVNIQKAGATKAPAQKRKEAHTMNNCFRKVPGKSKIMRVTDFQDYLSSKKIERVVYNYQNNDSICGLRLRLHFDRIVTCPELRQIRLAAGSATGDQCDSVIFDGVTCVKFKSGGAWDVAEITCQEDNEIFRHVILLH